ncbi:MAG TPA: hypothetical protein VLC98_11490 [Phnomibacter sp.]|nr:hypothetical protein [Phnomibacter sp.]
MKTKFSILFSILLSSIVFVACTKDDVEPDPTAGLYKLGSGFALGAGAKVELYTATPTITTGYQSFKIAVYDSITNTRIDDAHIHLTPTMDMGMMKHSAPYENPASTLADHHLFNASVFFIMASMSGSWTLDISIHNHANGKSGKLTLPITVAEPTKKRMLSFTSAADNSTVYFVSLAEPVTPKVGINNLELVVYKKASMMSFPADSSLSISFTPEMPTMGHSSPNNINPVHGGLGHYKGKVNYTMTGLWRLHFDFKAGATLAKTDSLDIEF